MDFGSGNTPVLELGMIVRVVLFSWARVVEMNPMKRIGSVNLLLQLFSDLLTRSMLDVLQANRGARDFQAYRIGGAVLEAADRLLDLEIDIDGRLLPTALRPGGQSVKPWRGPNDNGPVLEFCLEILGCQSDSSARRDFKHSGPELVVCVPQLLRLSMVKGCREFRRC